MRSFNFVVERDPDTGLFVGHVPGWPGAHSQGETLDELQRNLQEVVSMLLEDGEPQLESEFVGVQTIKVALVGKLPTLKPREVVALLEGLGFGEVRQTRFPQAVSGMQMVVARRFLSRGPRHFSDAAAQDREGHRPHG